MLQVQARSRDETTYFNIGIFLCLSELHLPVQDARAAVIAMTATRQKRHTQPYAPQHLIGLSASALEGIVDFLKVSGRHASRFCIMDDHDKNLNAGNGYQGVYCDNHVEVPGILCYGEMELLRMSCCLHGTSTIILRFHKPSGA